MSDLLVGVTKCPGSKEWVGDLMDKVFDECRVVRGQGQMEYAHRDDNAFANFERVAERLGVSREQVLLVYLEKHLDGIHAYVKGHKSQREDVRGRIKDAIVYLCLLRGMVEQNTLIDGQPVAPAQASS